LVVDNLPASATLFGIEGDTLWLLLKEVRTSISATSGQGRRWRRALLFPAASTFIDTAQTGITYSLRVLAGPGGR